MVYFRYGDFLLYVVFERRTTEVPRKRRALYKTSSSNRHRTNLRTSSIKQRTIQYQRRQKHLRIPFARALVSQL